MGPADFKSVVPRPESGQVGSIPTHSRQLKWVTVVWLPIFLNSNHYDSREILFCEQIMLKKITTLDAVFMALMAACGIALKPIVGPLAKLIGSAFFIPSGSIAGGIYMVWPMLALLVVRRTGTATLVGLIEGIVVMVTGIYGSHGLLTLITYTVPGIFIDLGFLLIRSFRSRWLLFLPTALGNLSGSLLVGIIIMHLPKIPLVISLVPAFMFGGFGGYLSYALYLSLKKSFPIFQKSEDVH